MSQNHGRKSDHRNHKRQRRRPNLRLLLRIVLVFLQLLVLIAQSDRHDSERSHQGELAARRK